MGLVEEICCNDIDNFELEKCLKFLDERIYNCADTRVINYYKTIRNYLLILRDRDLHRKGY